MRVLVCVALVVATLASSEAPPAVYSAVCVQARSCKVVAGTAPNAAAVGYYDRQINETGWNKLYINTMATASDETQAFAAGYLEGYLTHEDMYFEYVNEVLNSSDPHVFSFVAQNDQWARRQVAMYNKTQVYWAHVGLVIAQLDGLYAAQHDFSPADQWLSLVEIILLSADGDQGTLQQMYSNATAAEYNPMSQHCSVLIKVEPTLNDVFLGHTTWGAFNSMLRIYKFYRFNFHTPTASQAQAFSSYAGSLTSIDDFFVNSISKLVVTETTNAEFNRSIYQYVTPQGTLLSWLRTIVANRMASTGKEWTDIFARYNSGTYNNQWMILDTKLFTPGANLAPGLLWIIEQAPGLVISQDVTQELELGYWPSYNVPYFEQMFNYLGYPTAVSQWGPALFGKDTCVRAEIFRRDQAKAVSLDTFGAIMRYNNWQHDPLSLDNPGLQISSRFDLVTKQYPSGSPLNKAAFGGIDSKMTSYGLMEHLTAIAQSGPSHDVQPVFSWNDWPTVSRLGMPTEFPFTWEPMYFPVSEQ